MPVIPFFSDLTDLSSPHYAAIVTSDSTDFAWLTRGVYVGVTGDLVAVRADGTAVTFYSVPAGSLLPINAKRINATSTTASGLVALF